VNGFRIVAPAALYWLLLVPALSGVLWYGMKRRAEALNLLGESPDRSWRPGLRAALLLVGCTLIVASLARPAWNRSPQEVTRRGRDVVFIIDVSRSMLADDLRPNRLERAKLAVQDAASRLDGDRVALIAFAGTASVKCPLTIDYGFFRMALDELATDSVPRGGSRIGDAVRKSLDEVFDETPSQYRDIILITDGEDQDSNPVEAAQQAAERGVRLIAIGLGDETKGRRIPVTTGAGRETYLAYQGEEVWSRLDAATLRQMTEVTPGGRYLNVTTGAIDLADIYSSLIGAADQRAFETELVETYDEQFQILLGLGFLLLCIETIVSARRRSGGEARI
jgi:Ca-activated chloride channel family protein